MVELPRGLGLRILIWAMTPVGRISANVLLPFEVRMVTYSRSERCYRHLFVKPPKTL